MYVDYHFRSLLHYQMKDLTFMAFVEMKKENGKKLWLLKNCFFPLVLILDDVSFIVSVPFFLVQSLLVIFRFLIVASVLEYIHIFL